MWQLDIPLIYCEAAVPSFKFPYSHGIFQKLALRTRDLPSISLTQILTLTLTLIITITLNLTLNLTETLTLTLSLTLTLTLTPPQNLP